MRNLLDEHLDVAGHTVVLGSMSLTGHVKHHAFGHAGGNIDFYHLFARNCTFAVALVARVSDDFSFAVARRTSHLLLNGAENAACIAHYVARTVASGASFG